MFLVKNSASPPMFMIQSLASQFSASTIATYTKLITAINVSSMHSCTTPNAPLSSFTLRRSSTTWYHTLTLYVFSPCHFIKVHLYSVVFIYTLAVQGRVTQQVAHFVTKIPSLFGTVVDIPVVTPVSTTLFRVG